LTIIKIAYHFSCLKCSHKNPPHLPYLLAGRLSQRKENYFPLYVISLPEAGKRGIEGD
jgi:hypothetical protein